MLQNYKDHCTTALIQLHYKQYKLLICPSLHLRKQLLTTDTDGK